MEALIRAVAIVATLFVVAGFSLFAIDDWSAASERTQQKVAVEVAAVPRTPKPPPSSHHHGARAVIDAVNDRLLAPFAWVSDRSPYPWVRRGVPFLLAFLAYAFGLGYLARYSHGSARRTAPTLSSGRPRGSRYG